MYDFGLLLRQLREKKGLTQAQLAEKINRNKTVISKYESNTQSPTLDTLISFSLIFNVSLDYLAGISTKQAVSLEGMTPNQANIIMMLSQMFRDGEVSNAKGLSKHQLELLNDIIKEFV
ncbi:MAG: helix-turn-helix transcriptional regulator [Ruminococcus sp.]|nr:helix-turn-helix transcriptional regulator [Ruminococcus sp.]